MTRLRTKKRRVISEEEMLQKRPASPLCLQTGITVINEETSIHDANLWQSQLEDLYIEYFGPQCVVWCRDHMHALDQVADEALQAIAEPSGTDNPEVFPPPVFKDLAWRAAIGSK